MLTDRILKAVDELRNAIAGTGIEAVVVSEEMVSYRTVTAAVDSDVLAATEAILAANPSVWYSGAELRNLGGTPAAADELSRVGRAYIRSSHGGTRRYYMHRTEVSLK